MDGYIYGNKVTFNGASDYTSPTNYSTTETLIGSFNGEPLYQKTIYIQGIDLTNEIPNHLYGIVKELVYNEGVHRSTDGLDQTYCTIQSSIRWDKRNEVWRVTVPTGFIVECVTLRYTKL